MAPRTNPYDGVPPGFWERSDVVAGVNERSYTRLLLAALAVTGTSQVALAAACGITQSHLAKILKGDVTPTKYATITGIEAALGMPDDVRAAFHALNLQAAPVVVNSSRHAQVAGGEQSAHGHGDVGFGNVAWSPAPIDSPLLPAPPAEEPSMDRRHAMQNIAGLFVGAMAGVEDVRHDLMRALGSHPDEHWSAIVSDYAASFYITDPHALLHDLTVDNQVIGRHIAGVDDRARSGLCRAAASLATITAMTCASLGHSRQALRWWDTARAASDASSDTRTRVWVRGWEVANGLYERRRTATIIGLADATRHLLSDQATAGGAGLLAGLAQTLAAAGSARAISTLHQVADLTERMPNHVAADHTTMLGWPEVRLRHTESYVYTMLGDTARAYAAQDAALALYGPFLLRERAAMLLHRAQCMITDGDVSGGLNYAHHVLDHLPAEHHTELVYSVARQAVATVPDGSTAHPAAIGMRDRLALPMRSR